MNNTSLKVLPPTWNKRTLEWPTVLLFFSVLIIFSVSTYFALKLPAYYLPVFILINTLCVYSIFTVMHEASHGNISRKYSGLEYFMGVISGLMFHGSYEHFIFIHLKHHAKVNIPGEDPDLHAKGPITLKKLFIWCFTLPLYINFYVNSELYRRQSYFKTLYPYVLILTFYAFAAFYGFAGVALLLWLLPSMLGVALTVYVFDHLPHHPHSSTGKYTNARVFPHKYLDWILFMESYHLIHHLWPSIPWVEYPKVYAQKRSELLAAGSLEVSLFKKN